MHRESLILWPIAWTNQSTEFRLSDNLMDAPMHFLQNILLVACLWTLHAFVRDFITQEDVVGVFPFAGVDELKRCGSRAPENRDSLP